MTPRNSDPARAPAYSVNRAFALSAIILALSACTTTSTHKPTSRPKPAASAPAAATPGKAAVDRRNYEAEKERIKQSLAKNGRDALAPSDVGYYLDVLQGRLKQVAGKGIGISRQGERIVVDISNRATFDSSGTQISADFRSVLTPLSKVLVEYRMTVVAVRVRSDEAAARANHPRLAEQRAQALARQLVGAGIASNRIIIADTDPEHRARIELQVEPIVRAVDAH